jgi:hypothetical protein
MPLLPTLVVPAPLVPPPLPPPTSTAATAAPPEAEPWFVALAPLLPACETVPSFVSVPVTKMR